MKVTYDPEVDALYVTFSNGHKTIQKEINDDVILDLDDEGNMVGLEILDATRIYGKQILEFNLSFLGDIMKTETAEYTAEEAAEILKVNKETVLRKIRTGEIKATKLGKAYRISKAELDRLVTP